MTGHVQTRFRKIVWNSLLHIFPGGLLRTLVCYLIKCEFNSTIRSKWFILLKQEDKRGGCWHLHVEKGPLISFCHASVHSTVVTWGEENELTLQGWLLIYTHEIILTVVQKCLTNVYSRNVTTASEIYFDIL